jgi:hypothetical protein
MKTVAHSSRLSAVIGSFPNVVQNFYVKYSLETSLSAESIAMLPPFNPMEGYKWFSQIPANESLRKTGLHLFLSAKSSFTSLHLRSPVHVVPPLK